MPAEKQLKAIWLTYPHRVPHRPPGAVDVYQWEVMRIINSIAYIPGARLNQAEVQILIDDASWDVIINSCH